MSISNNDKRNNQMTIAEESKDNQVYCQMTVVQNKRRDSISQSSDNGKYGGQTEGQGIYYHVALPVGIGRSVAFASAEEIMFALGIPQMENPIPAGIIETSNGLHVPISLDISYLFGPDTAHVNASGISGNQKTSYLLFLLQSCYQTLKNKEYNKDDNNRAQGVCINNF